MAWTKLLHLNISKSIASLMDSRKHDAKNILNIIGRKKLAKKHENVGPLTTKVGMQVATISFRFVLNGANHERSRNKNSRNKARCSL